MITTGVAEEIWCELDQDAFSDMSIGSLPEGAVTVSDIMERYGVKESSARRRMNAAIEKGWGHGRCLKNGRYIRYIVKEPE